MFRYFATTSRGCESVVADELLGLGAQRVAPQPAGVAFEGGLEVGYAACLWSRSASRILLRLCELPASGTDELYAGIREVAWEDHMDPAGTLAITVTRSQSAPIGHSHYAMQRVKDGIVDRFRDRSGTRPSIELEQPDLRVVVHLQASKAIVSLDLSGAALHRRGYRGPGGHAPLKENLAAAILLRSGWGKIGKDGGALFDPMCGSGTFLIEGVQILGDIAPGLGRRAYGFTRWRGHDAQLWSEIVGDAAEREEAGLDALAKRPPVILGFDSDPSALEAARRCVEHAGFDAWIRLASGDLADRVAPGPSGLLVTNPPWGERLGELDALAPLYATLGHVLRTEFRGWRAAVFAGNPGLGLRMGLRAKRRNTMQDGPIECQLLTFEIGTEEDPGDAVRSEPKGLSEGAQSVVNRLKKNDKRLRKWAKKAGVDCYRLYDSDLPQYAVAIDRYADWVHVQEYAAPEEIEPQKAKKRLREALCAIREFTGLPRERVVLKERRRQRGKDQYTRLDGARQEIEVREGVARFWVNLNDYLDTGLFLDHRPVRARIGARSQGKHVLNLYAYTGTATVHAALGGARTTTTIDLSKTYLDWAQRNLELNGLEGGYGSRGRHRLIHGDCRSWLKDARGKKYRYDLIFLDPPTFSNSKRTEENLDLQRDHVELIDACMAILAPGGELIFSTNNRRFRLDEEALSDVELKDISRETLPLDFQRNPKIHTCFSIRHRDHFAGGR